MLRLHMTNGQTVLTTIDNLTSFDKDKIIDIEPLGGMRLCNCIQQIKEKTKMEYEDAGHFDVSIVINPETHTSISKVGLRFDYKIHGSNRRAHHTIFGDYCPFCGTKIT